MKTKLTISTDPARTEQITEALRFSQERLKAAGKSKNKKAVKAAEDEIAQLRSMMPDEQVNLEGVIAWIEERICTPLRRFEETRERFMERLAEGERFSRLMENMGRAVVEAETVAWMALELFNDVQFELEESRSLEFVQRAFDRATKEWTDAVVSYGMRGTSRSTDGWTNAVEASQCGAKAEEISSGCATFKQLGRDVRDFIKLAAQVGYYKPVRNLDDDRTLAREMTE